MDEFIANETGSIFQTTIAKPLAHQYLMCSTFCIAVYRITKI